MNAGQSLSCADRAAFGQGRDGGDLLVASKVIHGAIHVCGIAPEVGIAIFISTIIASGGQSLGCWSLSRPPLAGRLALLGRGGGGIRTHGTLAPWKDLGVLWIVSPAR